MPARRCAVRGITILVGSVLIGVIIYANLPILWPFGFQLSGGADRRQ